MTYEDIIEVDSAKERFMENYKMFTTYLYRFAEGEIFDTLKEKLKTGTTEEAFEAAHDMKGLALNLSLRKLEQPVFTVVEALRRNELPTEEEWKALEEAYLVTIEWIEKLKKEGRVLF